MNTLGLGRQVNTLGLGVPYGGAAPQPVVNDLVLSLVSEVVWPVVVELHGNEQKRKDYDKTPRKL